MERTATTSFTNEPAITARLQESFDCKTPVEEIMEEYVHVDDSLEVAEMQDCAETASLVVRITKKVKTSVMWKSSDQ